MIFSHLNIMTGDNPVRPAKAQIPTTTLAESASVQNLAQRISDEAPPIRAAPSMAVKASDKLRRRALNSFR